MRLSLRSLGLVLVLAAMPSAAPAATPPPVASQVDARTSRPDTATLNVSLITTIDSVSIVALSAVDSVARVAVDSSQASANAAIAATVGRSTASLFTHGRHRGPVPLASVTQRSITAHAAKRPQRPPVTRLAMITRIARA